MKRPIIIFLLFFIVIIQIQAQDYPFVPKDLKLLSMDELYSNPPPSHVDLVYYEDGKKTTFRKAMTKIESGKYIPHVFVNDKKEYKVLVLAKPKKGEVQGADEEEFKIVDLTGQQARPFSGTDLKGTHFSLDGLKGKVIVLNFWFTSCAPCVEEIPVLNRLVKEYANNKNVVFIGLALDNKTQLMRFLKKKKFDYHIIPDSKDIADRYEIAGFPTHVIIDTSSKVDYYLPGDVKGNATELKESINRCLKRLKISR